ncbi:MAG TPA: thioredoxin family protein [Eubacteriales bacterium]|nr:thioredoxin family protein [Eubacteriales bacterium]
MKLAVYGGGCASCKKLYENAQKAVAQAGVQAEIDYVTDMQVIMQKGFMTMPVLEIDGKVVFKGRVASDKEILALIQK